MVFDEPMVNVISIWIETTSCKHVKVLCLVLVISDNA
jgi:hypothetical protein